MVLPKVLNKIQCPIIIKTLNKLGIERNFLNWVQVICQDPQQTSYMMLKH